MLSQLPNTNQYKTNKIQISLKDNQISNQLLINQFRTNKRVRNILPSNLVNPLINTNQYKTNKIQISIKDNQVSNQLLTNKRVRNNLPNNLIRHSNLVKPSNLIRH